MKKINIFGLLLMLVGVFTSCKEENLIFEIEQPQFETREGYMLLEVIPPYKTMENDQIYIIGDFNGGMDAVGDPKWLMEKGPGSTVQRSKWGIYLNPSDFVDGKTLADGYTFYNVQQGEERSLDNEPVKHTEYPALGDRLNVMVYFWAANFNPPQNPDEVEHDGYAIYILNNSSWTDLYLWAWPEGGSGEDFLGVSWPGVPATGVMNVNGISYTYFDTGAAHEGETINIIINNNGSPQTDTYPNIVLDKDYYFELTADGTLVEYDPNASVEHDGKAIFVYNAEGWEELYIWVWEEGSGGEEFLGVSWPGLPFTGTQVINGVVYSYYDFGSMNDGKTVNVIVNNKDNGKQTGTISITLDKNYYYELTGTDLKAVDPETFQPGGATPEVPSDPDEPKPSAEYNIYILDETGWPSFYLYAYGDSNIFGDWPGETSTTTTTIGGVKYLVFTAEGAGETEHLIFNGGGDEYKIEQEDMIVTLDQNWYIKVTATGASFLETPEANIYVDNQTGWDEVYLYGWGEAGNDLFGGWPGSLNSTTSQVDGVNYLVWNFPANGKTENLIFNNGREEEDGKIQLDDFGVSLNTDMYLIINLEGVKFKE